MSLILLISVQSSLKQLLGLYFRVYEYNVSMSTPLLLSTLVSQLYRVVFPSSTFP